MFENVIVPNMAIDWSKIYRKYKGLWVVLKEDEQTVVSTGKTAKEAWFKAKEIGCETPILTRVPEKLVTYAGFGL